MNLGERVGFFEREFIIQTIREVQKLSGAQPLGVNGIQVDDPMLQLVIARFRIGQAFAKYEKNKVVPSEVWKRIIPDVNGDLFELCLFTNLADLQQRARLELLNEQLRNQTGSIEEIPRLLDKVTAKHE